jgi:hypothetical protein
MLVGKRVIGVVLFRQIYVQTYHANTVINIFYVTVNQLISIFQRTSSANQDKLSFKNLKDLHYHRQK